MRPKGVARLPLEAHMVEGWHDWIGCVLACATLSLCSSNLSAIAAPQVDAAITTAISDGSRPRSDTERDASRKPAETLAFAEIKAGDNIADYAAGSGYFTRLFASVVGPSGHVYASVPAPLYQYPNIVKGTADLLSFVHTHANVSVAFGAPLPVAQYPEKLDVFFISQNYHDLHDSFMGPVDLAAFNRKVFASLKPGGVYIVLDHVAAPGSAADVTDALHRIEPDVARREIEAAGFKFESSSAVLANPKDPHTAGVFDASIRGKTDQFIFKFRRPRT
jgi:predicted methyltransferase